MSTIEKALRNLQSKKEETPEVAPGSVERAESHATVEEQPAAEPEVRGGEQEAQRGANAGNVVNIPFDELHHKGFLTPAIPRSAIAEEFRGIKRPLLENINSKSESVPHANLIMVTSALKGDGKTFSSLNLAMSIAMEQDKTVLYVDADVLKASAGRLLGVPEDQPGLTDLLRDNSVSPQDVILHTNIDKLRLLPAGTADEHATELLASDNMHRLMVELSARYSDRVIVFDSPPLLMTTESGVLASFMGQIVFVVAADVTPQHAVTEALEHIGKDKMVGVMLNKVPRRKFRLMGNYGYNYVYGYGYGYGSGGGRQSGDAG